MIILIANFRIRFVILIEALTVSLQSKSKNTYGNALILNPPDYQSFRIASTYLM